MTILNLFRKARTSSSKKKLFDFVLQESRSYCKQFDPKALQRLRNQSFERINFVRVPPTTLYEISV